MKPSEKNVVITSAVRTPVGILGGSLKNIQGHILGSVVIKEVLKRSKIKSNDVDEVIMGQVLTCLLYTSPSPRD